jgi:hypothetical protein
MGIATTLPRTLPTPHGPVSGIDSRHMAGGQGKSGARPVRPRHCDRVGGSARRESATGGDTEFPGRRGSRSGSQETCPRPARTNPRGKGGSDVDQALPSRPGGLRGLLCLGGGRAPAPSRVLAYLRGASGRTSHPAERLKG